MTELFRPDGCLSDSALLLLIAQGETSDSSQTGTPLLTEEQRLEIAEHLSFCDSCLDRYTQLLCDAPLLQPPQPVYPAVHQKQQKREKVVFLRKFTSVAIAASMAMVFWVGGIFNPQTPQPSQALSELLSTCTHQITESTNDFSNGATAALNRFLRIFQWRGAFNNAKE